MELGNGGIAQKIYDYDFRRARNIYETGGEPDQVAVAAGAEMPSASAAREALALVGGGLVPIPAVAMPGYAASAAKSITGAPAPGDVTPSPAPVVVEAPKKNWLKWALILGIGALALKG